MLNKIVEFKEQTQYSMNFADISKKSQKNYFIN